MVQLNLLLQSKNGGHTTINRIRQPCLSLIGYGDHRLVAAVHRNMQQELRHVACAKHLVHGCETCCTLVWTKVGCKDAPADALPPQELACPTWRSNCWWPCCWCCCHGTLCSGAFAPGSWIGAMITTTLWLSHVDEWWWWWYERERERERERAKEKGGDVDAYMKCVLG